MKKLVFLFLLLISFTLINAITNFNLEDDEILISFIKENNNFEILISDKDFFYVVPINKPDKTFKHIYEITDKIDYIIDYKNFNISNSIKLYNYKEINNIIFENHNDNLYINYNNYNLCILLNNKINKEIDCDFIYINEKITIENIEINNRLKILFYSQDTVLNKEFVKLLYESWIDKYMVKEDELITIRISKNNYNLMSIPKNE